MQKGTYVSYRGKQLRADSIIFDKLVKLIAEGNITLVLVSKY